MMNMMPVTYGYARVSKSDRDDRNPKANSASWLTTACARSSSSPA